LHFSTELSKITQYKIAQQFFQVEASCCIRKDGQINIIMIIVSFATLRKRLKMDMRSLSSVIPSPSKKKFLLSITILTTRNFKHGGDERVKSIYNCGS